MYYLSGKSFRPRTRLIDTPANSACAALGALARMGLHALQLNYGCAKPRLTDRSHRATRSQVDNAQVHGRPEGAPEPRSNLTRTSAFFGSRRVAPHATRLRRRGRET